ncbi:DHFR domain-containing protein [Meloidogyne graminicola]|uniref:dihydrofolate reductase n=1 Tax=Meloidogyne graminicola TaxID=189291 RepID=A0A8T0A4E9_9BILA|nr:DHFR domain-containing protein [Meloidogyne graminicola]
MNIIAAVDRSFGIGKNNSLPWRLPKEQIHFMKLTTNTKDPNKINAVLMGRKCWESIPPKYRPLKNRLNIVLSKTIEPKVSEDLIISDEIDNLFEMLKSEPYKDKIETIWNVGGSEVYSLGFCYPQLDKLILTKIDKDFECDVKFPEIDWNYFTEEQNTEIIEEKGICWQTTFYRKIQNY